MKNLNLLFKECKKELDNIGIEYGNIISIKTDFNAERRWGQCRKHRDNCYTITISNKLLEDNIADKATKTVILHEILHSCKNGMQHKNEWKMLANKVNNYYGYNIKRTNSSEELGVPREVATTLNRYKYKVVCQNCGQTFYRMKYSNLIANPESYRCGKCKGEFKIFDLHTKEELN